MIVDTSVFVAFYDDKDPKYKRAVEIMRHADEGKIFISDYLVNEIATVCLRKLGLKKAVEIVDALTNSRKVIIGYSTKEDFDQILQIFKKQTNTLSFVDCSIIHMSKLLGMEVASFDKNLLDEIKANK